MRVWHSAWSWLKLIVAAESVAGNTRIGMFTRLILRKPFQVGRAGIQSPPLGNYRSDGRFPHNLRKIAQLPLVHPHEPTGHASRGPRRYDATTTRRWFVFLDLKEFPSWRRLVVAS